MTVIIGAGGRLGQGLIRAHANQNPIALGKAECHDWAQDKALDSIVSKLGTVSKPGDTVFVASGLLDPRLPVNMLDEVNFTLPRNVILAGEQLGLSVVTFGTVLEGMMKQPNAYVRSKERLSKYVAEAASRKAHVLHCRMHTLFGLGDPPPFMFLGQLFAAARSRVPLKMTSGLQLREYQHVLDTARAICAVEKSGCRGHVTISHGKPVKLRDIATSVGEAVGFPELGKFGALAEPAEENYGVVFPPTMLPDGIDFRDTIPAVAKYAAERISGNAYEKDRRWYGTPTD